MRGKRISPTIKLRDIKGAGLTAGYGFLALGSGDNPTFKSVFVSLAPKDQDSQCILGELSIRSKG